MVLGLSSHDPQLSITEPGAERRQYAALCWRMHGSRPEVLLITSRDTGRWVVPKGWPMAGRSPADAAAREAWEEAGVEGTAEAERIGTFFYDKVMPDAPSLPCVVELFSLRVERLTDRYPERRQRRRKWFSTEKAARKVAEPELQALILNFAGAASEPKGKGKAATDATASAESTAGPT